MYRVDHRRIMRTTVAIEKAPSRLRLMSFGRRLPWAHAQFSLRENAATVVDLKNGICR
jgi:hypothetical protein